MTWKRYASSKIGFIMVIFGCGIICIAPIAYLLLSSTIAESKTEHSFNVYRGANRLFESRADYGGSSSRKWVFFWTEDPISDVQQHYETIFPVFSLGNAQAQWLITGFHTDGSNPIIDTSSATLGHGNFCRHNQRYDCISLSLIDLGQHNPVGLVVTTPSTGMSSDESVHDDLASLPNQGTLIIYAYYIGDS